MHLPTHLFSCFDTQGSPTGRQAEPKAAGLFDDTPAAGLPEEQGKVFGAIKADVSVHIDELIELFEGRLTSSEIFTALFELEMANKIRQLPGKNYVRVF